jgi:SNF2 family DNA or RNA helicase
VLTTYALLPRDEEKLREHQYHLVILDESHYIKNNRSKAAQSAGLLNARHRLCLTGTPLENHLGELWSQFHFLLPGLLGDEKTFNSQFRHPIERQDDPLRRALLNRRIKPFLLRRTKDNVAKELPPKDRNGAQGRAQRRPARPVRNRAPGDGQEGARRDRQEGRGAQPDRDPRGAAQAAPGVLRSAPGQGHAARKKDSGSAKLIDLMQMVDDLLGEGRKILVFSQFTSMLALIQEELEARRIRTRC